MKICTNYWMQVVVTFLKDLLIKIQFSRAVLSKDLRILESLNKGHVWEFLLWKTLSWRIHYHEVFWLKDHVKWSCHTLFLLESSLVCKWYTNQVLKSIVSPIVMNFWGVSAENLLIYTNSGSWWFIWM